MCSLTTECVLLLYAVEACVSVKKETYVYGKRGLCVRQKRQKRPIEISIPEVCVCVRRGLFIWQKRPIYTAKEAYLHGKTGLLNLAYLR